MDKQVYLNFVNILKEELVPATGCTEPISVAYAAALARDTLGAKPENVEISVSGNILKNVKSVVVPNTGGLKGVASAAAAGIVAGNAKAELQVILSVTDDDRENIKEYLKTAKISVASSNTGCIFDISVKCINGENFALVRIAGHHTNVVHIEKNGEIILDKRVVTAEAALTDRTSLSVEKIVEFADEVNLADVKDAICRQMDYNGAIAAEGLKNDYGARVGKVLLKSFGNDVHNRAKATAAAGSDARMNGCCLPVIIVSGSGNQGMTASLPVMVYGEHLKVTKEKLIRALVVSDLVTIHLKSGIGRLSAYCGAVSAGCGAAAGVCYLYGGGYDEISKTLINALAIDSGVICDGAKSSCAAKIASAVEAGLVGLEMTKNGSGFCCGDGILGDCVEGTIDNVGELASVGMRNTDEEIIRLMIKPNKR
ncbi:MAG: L-serine ammonia-lyase, iron-sulfur-dependent, subunit alpha [Clostridia bacterium]|nr:L-serine ammonia-lyase, iron-sulfur-dependent, subunit alpha [Clostridia bacterium]